MDEPTTSRKLRVLIFSFENNPSVPPLQKFLLQKGCPVRTTYNIKEFEDIIQKPNIDFGMVIVLSPIQEKVFKNLQPEKHIFLEFAPGRCSINDLLKKVDAEAQNYGRY